MGSVLALPKHDAVKVRGNIVKAARLCVEHKENVHYTEGWQRWEGISHDRRFQKGEYPENADCSGLGSWLVWTCTRAWSHVGDFLNGENWSGGYTGTMTQHGIDIHNSDELKPADFVFYGGTYDAPAHVAYYVGPGKVISHGDMPGDPQVYPLNLYNALPVVRFKRYITEK